MKIVFFEIQSWESRQLKKQFPDGIFTKDKLSPENVDQYEDAEIISTFIYSSVSRAILNKLPNLKFVATRSTGYDHIDVSAAVDKGVVVSNVPEYGSRTVAEHTFGLILTLTKKIYQSVQQVKDAYDFNHENIRGIDLFEKTIGIVGLGKIGMETLKIAKGFGMNVLVTTRTQDEQLAKKWGFEYVDLQTLLKKSHVVSLNLPYTKETHHTINRENVTFFRKGSYLINTARGGLIETEAIIQGLQDEILGGVGLDVLEEEEELSEEIDILTKTYQKRAELKTMVMNHILIKHPNVIITPHNAFNSKDALNRITKTTIENIEAFIDKKSINTVKPHS
ncbi:MAG: hydroxyacid dehydrogenase [Candidatus Roizmanbacteria bacterium]|nr:hydroxyacid dehydrogenase [Candidatus Roizmanbacteria bacterium]